MQQTAADRPGGFLGQTYPRTARWLLRATIIPSDLCERVMDGFTNLAASATLKANSHDILLQQVD